MPRDPCAEPESQRLTLEAALTQMLGAIRPIEGTEAAHLFHGLGRVLAGEILSPLDLPPFPNAAMDGYALAGGDCATAQTLKIIGTSAAGHPYTGPVAAGECVRIFTGAALPPGADAVIAQEDVERTGDVIRMAAAVKPGRHVRPQGDDTRAGDLLLPAGQMLAPADLGLLASAGILEITVRRKLRVALFSTGDELRPAWQPLGYGEIYESNRYMLAAHLAEIGAEVLDFGNLPDDPATIRAAMADAAAQADAVITSGGASVGAADFVVDTLCSLGRIDFWKVAIKPGKPFAFGRIGAAYFFGLPGNPVSALVTFSQLARPALRRLMGAPDARPLRLHAICTSALGKQPGRLEFQSGIFRREPGGGFTVEGLPGQGAHKLSRVSRANCFVILPAENAGVAPGDTVEIEPFAAPA
jgi:molybdopterin molybdotransferase